MKRKLKEIAARIRRIWLRLLILLHPIIKWLRKLPWHKLRWMKKCNPLHYIKRIDWYIIKKFIGTYIYSIALIISISIVFDVNDNLTKFTNYHAPLRAIVFDYYANFIPYFANLFSPLFVFIAVIFFTSKLAGNSEIIAMLACGMSFKRLLRPYIISAALIAMLNFYLGAYVIPKGTVVRHDFESLYKNNKKNTSASNIQLMVDKGVVAYISQYDDVHKTGFGFSLYKFENKKMVSHMTASVIQYDTISDSRYHWKARSYKIRKLKGLREEIQSGMELDTLIQMPQAYRLIIRLLYPHHYRCFTIFKKTKRRHGTILRHWPRIVIRLYSSTNGMCHLRYQC